MHQHPDQIPVLPAMPPRRRRRRSHGPILVAIVAGALVAVVLMVLFVKERNRRLADETFQRAEELFQSGAFGKAQHEYEFFLREYAGHERAAQASMAAELSKVAQALDDDLADPSGVIDSFRKFVADSKTDPSLKARWPVILTKAQRSTRQFLEKANRALSSNDLATGDTWLKWLHGQQRAKAEGSDGLNLEDLDGLSKQASDRIRAEERRRGFEVAAEQAIATPAGSNFAQAFRTYDRWRAGSSVSDPAVAVIYDRLRQALRAQVRFEPPPQPAGESVDDSFLLPVESYTRLSVRRQHKPITLPTASPVFARVKDLCFALEPDTGTPRWVRRVGYDAWMPELIVLSARRAVLVPHAIEARPIVSLCEEATGQVIWSWRAEAELAGPPVATRDSVFVVTIDGVVWQLDLERGTPRGVCRLPEPVDSPPVLREDRHGLCVVGASQAVYLFDVGREVPECSDVVLMGRRSDTSQCQTMWVPPYVVIFENDLMSRCYVHIFFQEPSGHRSVREIELDGRLWQPPVLDGAFIFLVTDRWKKYCFGLDAGNPAVNLFTAATGSQSGEVAQPVRPHFARVDELPFVALSDTLRGYEIDRAKALLLESWSRPGPPADIRGVAPIQLRGEVCVTAWQEPSSDGLLVQAISARRGELIWETRLGCSARGLASVGSADAIPQLVAHTDSGGMFLMSLDRGSKKWQARVLNLPAPTSSLQVSKTGGEIVYASEDGSRVRSVSVRDWTTHDPLVQSPPIRSELSLFSGTLLFRVSDSEQNRTGRWVLFVTAERSVEIRPLDGSSNDINGAPLPATGSGEDLWPWAPLVLHDVHVIVAHPSGMVCRAEVRRVEQIPHLFITEQRSDLPALAGPPVALGDDLLCIGTDGHCVLLDSANLRTVSDWQAPVALRGGWTTDSERVFLGLAGSSIQALRNEAGKLVPDWQRQLEGPDWRVANVQSGHLCAVDRRGRILLLNRSTGEPVLSAMAPAPLAEPPLLLDGQLVLATIDGGVFFVPGPAAQ